MFLLPDCLTEHAGSRPNRIALIEGDTTIDYGQLEARVRRCAAVLRSQGAAPGDRVVVRVGNTIDSVVAIWAALRSGAVFVPVGSDSRPARTQAIANDCAARLVVDPAALAIEADARPGPVAPRSFEGERTDQDPAAIIYTSGTSGEPKGVVLAHRNLTNTTASIADYLGQRPEDVTCCILPLAFSYGLFQVLVAGRVGSCVLLEPSFAFPFDVLRRAARHRATMLPAVPTVLAKLLAMSPLPSQGPDGIDLGSLRVLTNAAAAVPPAHVLRLADAFPKVAFYAMYGQTECTRACFLDPSLAATHPSSVGRAIPNCETYLVDEAMRRLPNGSEGELVVRGANVMRGYWGRAEATAAKLVDGPLPGEKVLRTGDRFRTDRDGLLYFLARTDDIFKCRGEKVAPGAIEHVLHELPEVSEAAVIGVDDPNDGMAIKAVIVPRAGSGLSESRIRQHCRARLDPVFMPRFIELRDELPKTESGKLRRRDLLEGRPHS